MAQIVVPGTTSEAVWRLQRVGNQPAGSFGEFIDAAISSRSVLTVTDVWEAPTRTLTADPTRLRPVLFVPVGLPSRIGGDYLATYAFDTLYALVDQDPAPGTQTAETTRLTLVFVTPFLGPVTIRRFRYFVPFLRIYVDTVAATYNYRLYFQLASVSFAGTVTLLGTEALVASHSRTQAITAGWTNAVVNAAFDSGPVNITVPDFLAFRLRATSWASAAGSNSHGLTGIGSAGGHQLFVDPRG